MWYRGKHRQSFWKRHSLDILTVIGLALVFYFPLAVMFMK